MPAPDVPSLSGPYGHRINGTSAAGRYDHAVTAPPRWIVAALVGVALLALPTAAQATLVFTRHPPNTVVWAAADNGSGAHKLVAGNNPHVSPDGQIVALLHQGKGPGAQPELVLAPANASAPPTTLVKGWRDPYVFAWSPDSKSVAAVLGPEVGRQRLVLIDTVTGAQRTIARGFFNGVSFAPGGGALVYGRAASESFPPRSDVYRFDIPIPGRIYVQAPQLTHRLTTDRRSGYPLWSPNGGIVFVKQLGARKRRYTPKNELFTMNLAGERVRQLTHSKVSPLAQGLFPTAWSANGRRLLAQFEGQDLSYAVTVNAHTGAQRPLVEATEQGFLGTAVSADGKFVLGATGGFEPGPRHNVVSIPWGGGRQRILARNAFEPDWSR
jgi:Tol biopolymer transport system component